MSEARKVTGKVTHLQTSGKWTAKRGTPEEKEMFRYEICVDTGQVEESGQISFEGPPSIEVGQTHSFNLYPAKGDFPPSLYLDKPKAGAGFKGGGKQWTPDPERATRKERWAVQLMITRQACLNTAASLISSGGGAADFATITGLAEQLEAWVKRGIDLKSIVAHANGNGTPAQATVTNDPPAPYVKLPNAPLADVPDPF